MPESGTVVEKESLLGRPRRPSRGKVSRTLPVHWLAACFEGADGAVLSATFRALELQFGVGPSALSSLTAGQSLASALSVPVWAYLADGSRSRIRLLAKGCVLMGVWAMVGATATAFWQLLVCKVLTGIALSAVTPISQTVLCDAGLEKRRLPLFGQTCGAASRVRHVEPGDLFPPRCDVVPPQRLGFHFGLMGFSASAGAMLGAWAATSYGPRMLWGREGWRVVTGALGLLSVLFGALAPLATSDPREDEPATELAGLPGTAEAGARLGAREHLREARRKAQEALRLRTFRLIVLQGVFGAVPWSAMAFVTLWLQYVGLSSSAAGVVAGAATLAAALGGVLGGAIGDEAARRWPKTGRVRMAQLSVLLGLLHVPILFRALPRGRWDGACAPLYGAVMFSQGLCMSWCDASTNRPILSELAPPATRATVLAWAISLESASSALLGSPLVALLAEHVFGYEVGAGAAAHDLDTLPAEARHRNARAIGNGLMIMCCVPWTVCLFTYGLLARTYPREREAARTASVERE